jgi:hypothetical protein
MRVRFFTQTAKAIFQKWLSSMFKLDIEKTTFTYITVFDNNYDGMKVYYFPASFELWEIDLMLEQWTKNRHEFPKEPDPYKITNEELFRKPQ